MPLTQMAYIDANQLDSDLEDVADAIRAKSGGSSPLTFPAGFISEINAIPTGGGDPNENLIATNNNTVTSLSLGSNVSIIRAYMFYRSSMLETFDFSYITEIGSYAFSQGPSTSAGLTGEVIFDKGIALMPQCFQGNKITKIIAKNGCSRVDVYAFENNTLLTAVDLTMVGSFGIRANGFTRTPQLSVLVLRQNFVVSLNAALPSTCGLSSSGNIYVPSALVDSYKAATNWSTYADRILPIEGSYYETHWANGEAIA